MASRLWIPMESLSSPPSYSIVNFLAFRNQLFDSLMDSNFPFLADHLRLVNGLDRSFIDCIYVDYIIYACFIITF